MSQRQELPTDRTAAEPSPSSNPGPVVTGRSPADSLRLYLRGNAVFSLLTGAIAALDAGPVSDFLDVEQTWLVRAVGVGLLAFSVMLFLTARQSDGVIRQAAPMISLGDFGWVAATPVIIALGWLSTAGALVMTAVALVVLAFGIGQLRSSRRMS